jgi:hypothetical protein
MLNTKTFWHSNSAINGELTPTGALTSWTVGKLTGYDGQTDPNGWGTWIGSWIGFVGGFLITGPGLIDDAGRLAARKAVGSVDKFKPDVGAAPQFSRFKSPQTWINKIIDEHLPNVELTYHRGG